MNKLISHCVCVSDINIDTGVLCTNQIWQCNRNSTLQTGLPADWKMHNNTLHILTITMSIVLYIKKVLVIVHHL